MATATPRRIRGFSVDDLFGVFKHRIDIDPNERVAIAIGPNGVGKTTTLVLVNSLFSKNMVPIRRTVFSRLSVWCDDGSELTLVKGGSALFEADQFLLEDEPQSIHATLTYHPGEKREFEIRPVSKQRLDFPLGMLEREFPLERHGPRTWIDLTNNQVVGLEEIAFKYGEDYPPLLQFIELDKELTDYLESVKVHFIQTQRLIPERAPTRNRPSKEKEDEHITVQQLSRELITIMGREFAKYTQLSQRLDRTFPNRLLSRSYESSGSEETIREGYVSQEERRRRLTEAALLETSEDVVSLPGRELKSHETLVLSAYLEDVREKLSVFDETLAKIELLKAIVNERFLFKRLVIDSHAGLTFFTDRGDYVAPRDLSSGEQHELVLAFKLLFSVQEGTVVLVDEPEISLHVAWQQLFLDDVQRIGLLSDLDFVIATHSPHIINDRWDLVQTLRTDGHANQY